MLTPEEVENYGISPTNWSDTGKAAIVSFGRSDWLESFSPQHLRRCKHFRVMFYDEFLDVICEAVIAQAGPYKPQSSDTVAPS